MDVDGNDISKLDLSTQKKKKFLFTSMSISMGEKIDYLS